MPPGWVFVAERRWIRAKWSPFNSVIRDVARTDGLAVATRRGEGMTDAALRFPTDSEPEVHAETIVGTW